MLAAYGLNPYRMLVKFIEKKERLYVLLAEKYLLIFDTSKE